MKLVKRILMILLFLAILFSLGLWFLIVKTQPEYNGKLALNNLSEKVTVSYDEYGVPHINAQNKEDAYVTFGYVHAQERLWQMELMRRIAAGRLSEIFGEDLVKVDKFMSGLGIEEASAITINNLDPNSPSYKLAMAYLDGVNQYIEKGKTPLEFYLLGIEKEKYTLKDVYNVFGYMSFSFASAHKVDPLFTEIKEKLGSVYLNELEKSKVNTTLIKNQKGEAIEGSLSLAMHDVYEKLPVPSFMGSNAWVLGPKKTKNKKVIFANDPHISFSQPAIWYQSHIKTPDYEMYGFNIALMPFPLLGHNKEYAYGLTMFQNDDVNFYIEENNPENNLEYKTAAGYKKYKFIDKKIKIKGEKDTVYKIKVSEHGPIMNDLIEQIQDESPIAMQWVYTKSTNKMLAASYEMAHANSLKEFREGVSKIHAPGLNVMYGDAKDNIAWFAAGKLCKYRDSLSTKVYLNGSSGKDEIVSYLDFNENPQAINPDWNYVYSANNQPDSIIGGLYPGYYSPEDRAKRVTNLIDAKKEFSKDDVAEMIMDVTSGVTSKLSKTIIFNIEKNDLSPNEKEAVNILKEWDGNHLKNSVGPTIYNRFVYEFLKNTFKDELGNNGFQLFMKSKPIRANIIDKQLSREESVWWDDVTTKDKKERRKDVLTLSIKNTVSFLENQLGENPKEWQWKRVVSLEHEHAIGRAGGILRKIFNVGPFEINGGNEVINNHGFTLDSTGYYKVAFGPSSRRIIDFSDVENSLGIIPTGQSGAIFSPYYKDQTDKYQKGGFIKMKLNQAEIQALENKLIFLPKKN